MSIKSIVLQNDSTFKMNRNVLRQTLYYSKAVCDAAHYRSATYNVSEEQEKSALVDVIIESLYESGIYQMDDNSDTSVDNSGGATIPSVEVRNGMSLGSTIDICKAIQDSEGGKQLQEFVDKLVAHGDTFYDRYEVPSMILGILMEIGVDVEKVWKMLHTVEYKASSSSSANSGSMNDLKNLLS